MLQAFITTIFDDYSLQLWLIQNSVNVNIWILQNTNNFFFPKLSSNTVMVVTAGLTVESQTPCVAYLKHC